jgi:hypothetical protein
MLDVFALRPERNNVYRFLAQVPSETASPIAEKAGKQRLAQYLLLRIDFSEGPATGIDPLFTMSVEEIAAAARSTFWPLVLPSQTGAEGAELAGSFTGRLAKNILWVQPGANKMPQLIVTVRERLYCFETPNDDGGRVVVINRGQFIQRANMGNANAGVGRFGGVAMNRPFRNRGTDDALISLAKPSPLAGLSVLKLGDLGNNLQWGAQGQALPEWFKVFMPADFEYPPGFVKTAGAPTIIQAPATQPTYVSPDDKK